MLVSLLLSLLHGGGAVSCKNEAGLDVDWFIAIKPPKSHTGDKLTRPGTGLLIWDSTMRKSTRFREDTSGVVNGSVARTLEYMYGSDPSKEYVIINDQYGASSAAYAHQKTVIMADPSDGSVVWLEHSVPKWPPRPKSEPYGYAKGQQQNGQSFICVTLNAVQADAVLGQYMSTTRPRVVEHQFAASTSLPRLRDVVVNKTFENGSVWLNQSLRTRGGLDVSVFAKSSGWGKGAHAPNYDLWEEVTHRLAPKGGLGIAETWRNGQGGKMGPYCMPPSGKPSFAVLDAREIAMGYTRSAGGATAAWKSTQDHSKWMHTAASYLMFVCIGDINRMTSQSARGGGALCFDHSLLTAALTNATTQHDECP